MLNVWADISGRTSGSNIQKKNKEIDAERSFDDAAV